MNASRQKEGLSLKRWSFNASEHKHLSTLTAKERVEAFNRNLNSYVNHVLEDSVVSIPYYYETGENDEILVYPGKTPLMLDEAERGGLYKLGLSQAIKDSKSHPYNLVFLYSPAGMTSFDDDPENPYSHIGAYNEGQLYVMFYDGQKVNNVAVGISSTGEDWVREVLGPVYDEATAAVDEKNRISTFITSPQLTDYTIDSFLNFGFKGQDRVIYTNNKNKKFSLAETLFLMRESFSGELKVSRESAFQEHDLENMDENFIEQAYKSLIASYMIGNGLEKMTLGGSCGDDNKINLLQDFEGFFNNMSSLSRLLTQMNQKMGAKLFDPEKHHKDYNCPDCGFSIPGELKGSDPSTWRKFCPNCGSSKIHCE